MTDPSSLQELVWTANRSMSNHPTTFLRSLAHLCEPDAEKTLCGVGIDWPTEVPKPADRRCKRCQRIAEKST